MKATKHIDRTFRVLANIAAPHLKFEVTDQH